MLNKIADGIWVVESEFKMSGLKLGGRTTVVALEADGLAIISPIRADEPLFKAIAGLGQPLYVIAPNLLHHLFASHYLNRFPESRLLAAPGLGAKRKDLTVHATLSSDPLPKLAATLDFFLFQGMPRLNEIVFYHRATKTLIVSDLVLNIRGSDHWSTRTYLKLNRAYGQVGQTILHRLFTKDGKAARASRDRLLEWDIQRVILAHGEIIQADQLDEFRQALGRFG